MIPNLFIYSTFSLLAKSGWILWPLEVGLWAIRRLRAALLYLLLLCLDSPRYVSIFYQLRYRRFVRRLFFIMPPKKKKDKKKKGKKGDIEKEQEETEYDSMDLEMLQEVVRRAVSCRLPAQCA